MSNPKCCFRDETSSEHKLRCCSVSSDCDPSGLPMPPGPPTSRPPSSIPPQTDFDTLSEKYWGEILERTVSSSSLQALQRTYNNQPLQQNSNITQQLHQFGCIKSSTIDLNNGYYHHQQIEQQIEKQLNQQPMRTDTNLANFSNSEPRLCDHYLHDINCAKNKLYLNDTHPINGLPDI